MFQKSALSDSEKCNDCFCPYFFRTNHLRTEKCHDVNVKMRVNTLTHCAKTTEFSIVKDEI